MVQRKLTFNKVDVCDHIKNVETPKEVVNDQNFVEKVYGSNKKYTDELVLRCKAPLKV